MRTRTRRRVLCAVVTPIRTISIVLAAAALFALAGCGSSGDSKSNTLDQAQQKRFDTAIEDFLTEGTTYILAVRRCARRTGRAACVREASAPLNVSANKTRATIGELQRGVSGACASQLNLAAGQVTQSLDVLLPIGVAARGGNARTTKRLSHRVVAQLKPLASTVRAQRRACKG
jgi:predicted small lipoprotein YifL